MLFGSTPTPMQGANITWSPINAKDKELSYLDINTNLTIQKEPRADAMDFWDDLYKEYGSSYYNTFRKKK